MRIKDTDKQPEWDQVIEPGCVEKNYWKALINS
jgi:hypothetical protein